MYRAGECPHDHVHTVANVDWDACVRMALHDADPQVFKREFHTRVFGGPPPDFHGGAKTMAICMALWPQEALHPGRDKILLTIQGSAGIAAYMNYCLKHHEVLGIDPQVFKD